MEQENKEIAQSHLHGASIVRELPKLCRKTEPSTGETVPVWQEKRSDEATHDPAANTGARPDTLLPGE